MPVKLTKAIVDKAISDAVGKRAYDLTDSEGAGLVLRAAPRGAHYLVRFLYSGQFKRLRVGSAAVVPLAIARTIARLAQTMSHRDYACPTPAWVQEQLVIHRVLVAAPLPEPVPSVEQPATWTFAEARDAYLSEVKRTLRPSTWVDRRGMLGIKELAHLAERPAAEISRNEIATIVADIFKSGRERNAGHLAEVIRPMWSWLGDEVQRTRSGVLDGVMLGLKPPKATNREAHDDDEAGTYLPLPDEIGRVLAMIRMSVVHETMSDACLLLLFTSQRRRTVVTARRTHFVEEDGVLVWQIPPRYRKTGRGRKRSHDLPLPAEVATMVRRRLADEANESPWLFQGIRPRRSGDEVEHLHADTLTHTFADLPGITMSPHDTRRAFTTYLEDILGLDQADLKPVLDHSEGKASNDVTDSAYSKARRLKRKSMILEAWAGFLAEKAAKADVGQAETIKMSITASRVHRARLSAQSKRTYTLRKSA